MAFSMVRVLVFVCLALLVANVDSARTLKQSMQASTTPTEDFVLQDATTFDAQDESTPLDAPPTEEDSFASQDQATTFDAAPKNASDEYDYNKSDVTPQEDFPEQGSLYSEAPPLADDGPGATTHDAFADGGIFVSDDHVEATGNPYGTTTPEYSTETDGEGSSLMSTDSFAQDSSDVVTEEGKDVTGDGEYPSFAANTGGSSGNPDGYVYDASEQQETQGYQFNALDTTSNYDSQPDAVPFTYEETMPGN